jgi:hypothetical protein
VPGDGFEPSVPGTKEPVFVAEGELRGPNGGSQKGLFLMRYRWFESISLQRRVRNEPDPSLRGRRSIHQLDRCRRDIRRLGRQRRYGFDCDVRGMIMPGIESRNQGGREHATQPDPDQNLACRPFAAAQGLGGHAGAASPHFSEGVGASGPWI